jgi:hypothetical protein
VLQQRNCKYLHIRKHNNKIENPDSEVIFVQEHDPNTKQGSGFGLWRLTPLSTLNFRLFFTTFLLYFGTVPKVWYCLLDFHCIYIHVKTYIKHTNE